MTLFRLSTEQVYEIMLRSVHLKSIRLRLTIEWCKCIKRSFSNKKSTTSKSFSQMVREIATLKKHNKKLQERSEELNTECLRLKNYCNMKTIIHVNQHIIRSNGKTGATKPVLNCVKPTNLMNTLMRLSYTTS